MILMFLFSFISLVGEKYNSKTRYFGPERSFELKLVRFYLAFSRFTWFTVVMRIRCDPWCALFGFSLEPYFNNGAPVYTEI